MADLSGRGPGQPIDQTGIDPDRVPVHVGLILDGNGRWANARGLPRTAGHAAGEAALFDVVEGAVELGDPLAVGVHLLHRELVRAPRTRSSS